MPAGLRAVRALARLTSWVFPARVRREYGAGFPEVAEHHWRREAAHSSAGRATLTTTRLLIADAAAAAGPSWMAAADAPRRPVVRLARALGSATGGGWSDLRLAARTVARRPAFTLLVVLTLGVGIGASSAGFDALDRAVFHPLGFPHADRLVFLAVRDAQTGVRVGAPLALVERWQAGARSLEQIERFDITSMSEVTADGAMIRPTLAVSGGLPGMLGVRPVVGRMLGPADGDPAAPPAVMLSEQYWRQAFGADPSVVGRVLRLSPGPATIVGVWPAGARLDPVSEPDLVRVVPSSTRFLFFVLARRAPGRSVDDVQHELSSLSAQVPLPSGGTAQPIVTGMDDMLVSPKFQAGAWLAFAGALALLLVALANAGYLLVSRALGRRHELGVRQALGGSRLRLARLFLAEGFVYSMLAAIGSLPIAAVIEALVQQYNPQVFHAVSGAGLGGRALVFAVSSAAAATLACSAGPFLRRGTGRGRLGLDALGAGHSTTPGSRVLTVLIGAQAALAVSLLFGAALMAESVDGLLHVDTGIAVHRLSQFVVAPHARTPEAAKVILQDIRDAVGSAPGIIGVTTSSSGLMGARTTRQPIVVDGEPLVVPSSGALAGTALIDVEPNYFRVLGIRLLEGRSFRVGETGVAIVNDAIARGISGSVLGHTLRIGDEPPLLIVGVAANRRLYPLSDDTMRPIVYTTDVSNAGFPVGRFAIRSSGNPSVALREVRSRVARINPQLVVQDPLTGDDLIRMQTAQPRLVAVLLGGIALVGLVLAVCGIYAAVTISVARRTREIGVRLALGATSARVAGEAIRRELRPVLAGAVLGGLAGAALAPRLEVFLFRVSPHDPVSGAASVGLILAAATAAAWVASRIVARIDPAVTLRST